MDSKIEQVVLRQKSIEYVGTDDYRRRHANLHSRKASRQMLLVQNVPHESQAACLTSQRSRADPEKERISRLERCSVEVPDQVLALLATVIVDGLNQIVPKMLQAGKVGNLARPQLLRHRKLGPRRQPTRKVVSLAVIPNAL